MKALSAAASALLLGAAAPAPRPQIAITIDDLPVHAPYPPELTPLQVNRQMIAALKAAHVPATAFVNAINVKDASTMKALRDWRTAGFVLGNHTWSHPRLGALTLPQFQEEVAKDDRVLRKLGGGSDWRWFRYPFLDEGKDEAQRAAARQVLAQRGYKVAAVTMGFSDWAFTPAYARCMGKGDKPGVAELERLYLRSARENIAASRTTAHKLYGRDIPYVLLMHDSAMSANMMPQVIRLYRAAGFLFVSLPQAERDPAYGAYTDLRLPPPPSPQELAARKHVQLAAAPDYSAELNSICT
jgi:peptidoglycan/xylan/chitin deacetylase (PgdA/CDA1 family)